MTFLNFVRMNRHVPKYLAVSLSVLVFANAAMATTPTACGTTNLTPSQLVQKFRNVSEYPNFTLVCAHRGFWTHALHPQNSHAAFQEAIDWGLDCVENDIRKTSDGHYVIFHDAKMDMMVVNQDGSSIGNNREIGQYTLAQLNNLRLRDRLLNKTDEKIQTLDEHLVQLKGNIVGNHEFKDPNLMGDKHAFVTLLTTLKNKNMLDESIIKGKLSADDYEWVLQQVGVSGSEVTYTPKFFNDPSTTQAFLQSEIAKFRQLGVKGYELVIASDAAKNNNLRAVIPDLGNHYERYGQFDLFPESGRGRYKAVPPRNKWDGSTPDPDVEKRGDWDWITGSQNYTFMVSDRPCLIAQYLELIDKR